MEIVLNKFCLDCPHRSIPDSIKSKYDKLVKLTFPHCPLQKDDCIIGCTIKYWNIDWKTFIAVLKEKDLLTEKEVLALEEDAD
jgi:hypothetical protein